MIVCFAFIIEVECVSTFEFLYSAITPVSIIALVFDF